VNITRVVSSAFTRRIKNKLPLRKSAGVVAQAAEERCRLPLAKEFSKRRTSTQVREHPRLTRLDAGAASLVVIMQHADVRI
jgi:hypothetical protein